MVCDDALRADVYLVVLTKILGFLLRVTHAKLNWALDRFVFFGLTSVELIIFDLLEKVLSFF